MSRFWAGKCYSKARLDGKTAIITGSNTGIGKETALDFAQRGCRVIMTCRAVERGEKARNDILEQLKNSTNPGELVVKSLDLSSLSSVRNCAQELLREEKRIDLLINNAGVMVTPYGLTEDGYETQFATNHLGHFLFTLLLIPKIINSTPARIVNLSSLAHKYGPKDFEDINWEKTSYSAVGSYGRSKLANILFTKELARRLEGKNVNVYAVHPGVVKTELGRHISDVYSKVLYYTFSFIGSLTSKTPKQGAQTTIYCAVDEKTANETGLYYDDCRAVTPSGAAQNMTLAKALWDKSLEMVKLDVDPLFEK